MAAPDRISVHSGGLRLAASAQGTPEGPTVLLVHGYPDNAAVWDGVAAALRDRFRVVRYDVRGHGGSQAPAKRAGYRIEQLVEDMAAVAAATSPDRPVHLVGHDWGATQGWAAVRHPRHAALFASFTAIGGVDLDHVALWLQAGLRRRGGRAQALRQLARSWQVAAFAIPGLGELGWRITALRRRFGASYADARNGLQLYRANLLRRPDPDPTTTVPVLQIALTRDPFCPPAVLAAAEPWCPRLYRRELPAGHAAPRTHPAEVAGMVADFVRGAATAAGPAARPGRV